MKPPRAVSAALLVILLGPVFLLGQAPAAAAQTAAAEPATSSEPSAAGPQAEGNINTVLLGGSIEHLTEALSLSERQQEQVRGIMQNQRRQMSQLEQNNSLQPPERKQKMRAIRAASREKIRALLDENQKAKYDQMPGLGQQATAQKPTSGAGK